VPEVEQVASQFDIMARCVFVSGLNRFVAPYASIIVAASTPERPVEIPTARQADGTAGRLNPWRFYVGGDVACYGSVIVSPLARVETARNT
jgi:hypothetical protein